MAYDLHITRADNWAENELAYIEAEEWLRLIEDDAELMLDVRNGPYFAVWSGPCEYDEPWFDWFAGNVNAKYPDRMMLGKMLQIADRLGARVQGDDGEIYASPDDHPGPLPARETTVPASSGRLPFERRERLWNLVMYGVIALLIIAAILLDLP